jgi:hypothetical protein
MEEPIEIGEHSYTNPELHGLYDELLDAERPYLIVGNDLSYLDREALTAEAECYRIRAPRDRMKFCYSPSTLQDMDRERIRALRRRIEDLRPDWVECVRLATKVSNDVYEIVGYSGVPPYPAVAILENMLDRGELPEG